MKPSLDLSKLLDNLDKYSEAAATCSSVHIIARVANEFLNSAQSMESVIKQNTKLSGILVYKCLRMFQEIDSWNINDKIESSERVVQIQSVLANLRSFLSKLFKINNNFSRVCGKEFIRMILDRALIQEHMPNCKVEKFIEDTDPDADFVRILIPKSAREKIEEVSFGRSISEIADALLGSCNNNTVHLYVGDLIRYIMLANFGGDMKADLILELINRLPFKEETVTSFEVAICICIDIFTFKSKDHDKSAIEAFFKIYNVYPDLLYFVERVAKKFSKIPYSISSAMQACGVELPSTYVQWPVVDEQEPVADTASILTDAINKMKWSRDNNTMILTNCITQLLQSIGVCDLDIPVKKNAELSKVLKTENVPIIGALCSRSVGIFKLAVYELGMMRKYQLAEGVILDVLKGGAAEMVLPAMCKVLVVLPEMIDYMGSILTHIPETADPIPFIRYMCYNCTGLEIMKLTSQRLLFPMQEQDAAQLFRESMKWRQTPQSVFWGIVRKAYINHRYTKIVIGAILASYRALCDSQCAFAEMRMFLRKTRPQAVMAPLFVDMVKGPESIHSLMVSMLRAWTDFYLDDTMNFIQKKLATVRQLCNVLSEKHRNELPHEIKHACSMG